MLTGRTLQSSANGDLGPHGAERESATSQRPPPNYILSDAPSVNRNSSEPPALQGSSKVLRITAFVILGGIRIAQPLLHCGERLLAAR
eukprot:690590-Prymnesium_polylepis.2